jgi:hypothetical protein
MKNKNFEENNTFLNSEEGKTTRAILIAIVIVSVILLIVRFTGSDRPLSEADKAELVEGYLEQDERADEDLTEEEKQDLLDEFKSRR